MSLRLGRVRFWLRRRGVPNPEASPGSPSGAPAQEFPEERVQDATFRIRNLSSLDAGTGAGFAIGPHLIVSNRHVVEGGDLEVTTSDGRVLEVGVVEEARGHDLAVLKTVRALQGSLELAQQPVGEGELVHVVGYPLGGPFMVTRGLVVDEVQGPAFGEQSHVLRVKAVVLPGYSGGPVLNVRGEIVGVVYALGRATRYALAIPVSSLERWLEAAALDRSRPVTTGRIEPREPGRGA